MAITFLMGRLPPRTGGEMYNFRLQEHLRALGYPVRYVHVTLLSCLLLRRGLFIEDEHFTGYLLVTNLLRRLLKLGPLVIVCHHLDGYQGTWLQRLIRRARLCLADRIVAVSRYTREQIVSLGIPAERVEVIPPGYAPEELPEPSFPARSPVKLLCVAACIPRKGLVYLLEAMASLEARLHIVGDTDTSYYRKVLAPRAGEKVIFEGRVSAAELRRHYESSDIFVLPSLCEGFGIVLLEAMHCGLPVVASRAAAIPELVEEGVNGRLVPPRDPRALAQALGALIADPEQREKMGREGRRRVQGRFSWDLTCARFVEAILT